MCGCDCLHLLRIYGYHLRQGDERRVAQRDALQVLGNIAESTYASLQHYGFGLKGQTRAKWVQILAHAEWLVGGGLLAMNMRKLIHGEGGAYERAHEAAGLAELLKPQRSTPGALLRLVQGYTSTPAPSVQLPVRREPAYSSRRNAPFIREQTIPPRTPHEPGRGKMQHRGQRRNHDLPLDDLMELCRFVGACWAVLFGGSAVMKRSL